MPWSWANARRCWPTLADDAGDGAGASRRPATPTDGDDRACNGGPQASRHVAAAGAALAGRDACARHHHHHHRFDAPPAGPGAEIEASRGCPYHCTFCAKENFRDRYRRRAAGDVLDELDGLIAAGRRATSTSSTRSSCPDRALLEALVGRGRRSSACRRASTCGSPRCSSCSAAPAASRSRPGSRASRAEGRDALDKHCQLVDRGAGRAADPRQAARALRAGQPDRAAAATTRRGRRAGASGCSAAGVWANEPVPLFPYPGSPDYRAALGRCRTTRPGSARIDHYLAPSRAFSDIQDERPLPLAELERVMRVTRPPHRARADDRRRRRRGLAPTRSTLAPRPRRRAASETCWPSWGRRRARRSAARRARSRALRLELTGLPLDGWTGRGRSTRAPPAGCWSSSARSADLVHVNGYAQARCRLRASRGRGQPTPACSRGGGRCRGGDAAAEWDGYAAGVAPGLARGRRVVAPTAAHARRPRAALRARCRRPRVIPTASTADLAPRPRKRAVVLAAGRLWDEAKNLARARRRRRRAALAGRRRRRGERTPDGRRARLRRARARPAGAGASCARWMARGGDLRGAGALRAVRPGILEAALARLRAGARRHPEPARALGRRGAFVAARRRRALRAALAALIARSARAASALGGARPRARAALHAERA